MSPVALEIRRTVAIVTVDNPPVNALSHDVRAGLLEAVATAGEDPNAVAVVIHSAGRTFIAGADIRELDHGLEPPETPEIVARIERLAKPTIAAIHGHALGGGLEIALACHGRIATPDARLGFPEVRLGLIPGAGGTQRLPRLVGVARALDLMISGESIDAEQAREVGIVDAVAPADRLLDGAVERARELAAREAPPRRTRDLPPVSVDDGFFDEYRRSIAARTRGQLAPECIVRSVENAVRLPFDAGLRAERELFLGCMRSAQSKALRYAFFAERDAAKPPAFVRAAEPRPISTVAIVGAGTMGAGIAYCCLDAGFHVLLQDVSTERVDQARATIAGLAKAAVEKGRRTPQACEDLIGRLGTTVKLGDAAVADLVIEAVYESMGLKCAVFAELDSICRTGVLLATNTSTLNVDAIAAATRRPENVIGLHFFSPAHAIRLIEIVRGAKTSAGAVATAVALSRRLGKLGVVVGNGYGFVGNRMYHSYGRESQLLLLEGAAPDQVDAALCDWGMAMGPNAVGDLAGLDVGYRIRQERRVGEEDPRHFRVADRLVELGRYGQKTGAGIYRYAPGSRIPLPDPEVTRLIAREAKALGIVRRRIDAREIVERCVYALIVEGARVLEDGIVGNATRIDAVWLNGYGFPRHRGGPMYYADHVGLGEIYARVREFEDRFDARYWEPPRLLADLARRGLGFADLTGPRSSPRGRCAGRNRLRAPKA